MAGRKTQGHLTGSIFYGASKPSRQLLRRYVGYVEQQDTLVDTLTGELPNAKQGPRAAPGRPLWTRTLPMDNLSALHAVKGCE